MIFLRPLHYAPKVSAPEDGIFGAGGVTGLYAWVWEWAVVRMGVVWCGVVWCGVVWCGVVQVGSLGCMHGCGNGLYAWVWCGVVWCGAGGVTGLYGWVWERAVRMGLVWCGVVWCGVVWCGAGGVTGMYAGGVTGLYARVREAWADGLIVTQGVMV